jgi:cobalt-zinc-cadmium efflux system outer membrane protein
LAKIHVSGSYQPKGLSMSRFFLFAGIILFMGCVSVPEFVAYEPAPGKPSPLTRQLDQQLAVIEPVEAAEYDLARLLEFVDHSPAMLAARASIERESGAVLQGSLRPNPMLRLETQFMPLDNLGFGDSANKIGIAQRFETAGKAGARVELAQAKQEEAQAQYFHLRAQAMAAVAKEFHQVVFTERKKASLSQVLELKGKLLRLAQDLNAQGRLSAMDLIAYQVAVDETAVTLKSLEAEERTLLRKSEGRLGLSAGLIGSLAGEAAAEWTPLAAADARQAILSRNSELLVLDRKVKTALANKKAADRLAYPDVTAMLGYARNRNMMGDRDNFVFGMLEIPLPLTNRNQGNIKSAEVAIRQTETELVAAAQRVLSDWQAQLERWEILSLKRDLYRESIIPALEKDLALKEQQVAAGRQPVQTSLETAAKLEQAIISALEIEQTLMEITVEIKYLLGQELL